MSPTPGETFPAQALPTLDGASHDLSEVWREGPGLVILGHRDCKTTRQTLPYVDRIHRRGKGAVVAILQDSPEVARGLQKELALELPVVLEAEPYGLSALLHLQTVPTLFLVEKGGRISRVTEGFSRKDLEAFASDLGVASPLFDPDDASPERRPG